MSYLDGKLVIVTSSPGDRDTIYVGFCKREGDMLILSDASMVVHYKEVGVAGIAKNPEHADRLRPATGPEGRWFVPLSSVAGIVEADPEAWKEHLGKSRG